MILFYNIKMNDVNETELLLLQFKDEINEAKNNYEKMIMPYIKKIVDINGNESDEN